MKRWFVLLALGALALRLACHERPPGRIRIATFNIEHFPKSERQVDGAFADIAQLDTTLVAAQEITDRARFVREARARLGASWDFVCDPDRFADDHHLGVLFDRDAWRLLSTTTHSETVLGRYDLPVLEARLASRDDGDAVRVLVVHLRPLTRGRDARAQQLVAVGTLAAAAMASGERVAVLGDFNATEAGDRVDIAAVATGARMTWATEPLACSAFWDREDSCPRSRLDHVLTSAAPVHVEALGACAVDGCGETQSCPLWSDEVSDHCPVVVDF